MSVARLPAEFKLGIFQRIADAVEEGDFPDILTAIKAMQKEAFASVKGGQTIIAASGGGFSTQFAIPGKFSPQELFAFWPELRSIYTDALAFLASNGNSSPTQPEISAQMQADDRFESITCVKGDFTLLNVHGGGWR